MLMFDLFKKKTLEKIPENHPERPKFLKSPEYKKYSNNL